MEADSSSSSSSSNGSQSDKEEVVNKNAEAVKSPTPLPPQPRKTIELAGVQQNGHNNAGAQLLTARLALQPQPIVLPAKLPPRRKMSVMLEEDSSDDLDNDAPSSVESSQPENDHSDSDSDSTYQERGRLLSTESISGCRSMRKSLQHIPCAQAASHGSQSSRASSRHHSPVQAKRSAASTSLDSFHEKSSRSRTNTPPPPCQPTRQQQQQQLPQQQQQPRRTQQQQQQPQHHHHHQQQQRRQLHRPFDCNSHSSSRRGDSASRHCSRNPSMRSLKSSSASDEHHCVSCSYPQQQQQQQQHQQQALQLYPSKTCASWGSILFPDTAVMMASRPTDAVSIRSLASIGMGSSDGRKLTIRRVPTSPSELLNMVQPATPVEDDLSTCTSYDDCDAEDPSEYRQPRRPHWENKVQFVLACIGYSVGLGNVWRFPYLCYKSGGGVFLIPYFLVLVVCGVPLLYMELSIGQFTRRGPIGALGQICPLFKGAGLSSVVISFIMSTYHNVIIAYAIYYFFTGCKSIQPWSNCDNKWNTPSCWPRTEGTYSNHSRPQSPRIPAAEFFDRKVLKISQGIEYPGSLRWELAACLIAAWVIVYFSIWKSIKSSARVRYITATLPFLLIFIFLTRSLTLEGADQGLQFFFHPDWQLLKDAKVWVNAAAQIFNSVGIAFGSMICFASYNKFHNNILIDAVAVSLINAFSCLLVGIFAFATIGNIAVELNMTVPQVLNDGPGLVFVVYPQALAKMPWSQMWATLFFFMLVCLTLNSQFAIVEVVVTSIQDGFPKWVKKHLMCHEMLVLLVCIVSFLLGLPNVTEGGIYFFQLIDHYAASISIMFLAFFEVIAISWFYGVRRLCSNVKEMTGRAPGIYFRFCWLIAAPLLIMAVWVFSLIDYEPPHYTISKTAESKYRYPWWAEAIGWGIASLSLVCIPAFAGYVLYRAEGATFAEKLRNSIKSDFEACEVCGQEYCTEPAHSTDDDVLKEPLHEMNNVMVVQTFQPPKTQL